MIIRPATGPGSPFGWLHDSSVESHEDILYRLIQIDEDRYSGAYSGAAFTAWPGVRPTDLDAGDIDCHDFWLKYRDALHGRGDTAQEAFRDLVQKIEVGSYWDWDVTLSVVMIEHCCASPEAYVNGSDDFKKWLEES